LNYTHKGKVDVIYIDPPYNTGKDGFKYKDKRITNKFPDGTEVPKEHPFRHSYWLSFMRKRLELAKELLSPFGFIFISIDDNEMPQLKILMDEIFLERNFIGTIVRKRRKSQANLSKNLSTIHEYILCYSRSPLGILNKVAGNIKESDYSNPDHDPRGDYVTMPCSNKGGAKYRIVTSTGKKYVDEWRYKPETYEKLIKENRIVFPNKGNGKPRYKLFLKEKKEKGVIPNSWWADIASNQEGSSELKEIFGGEVVFENPKPVGLIREIINIVIGKTGIVLDFFAGSGTTVHAVLDMNKHDGGNRQCIVCTNNENNICEETTYPRISKVINGYEFEGKHKEVLFEKKLNVTAFKKASQILEEIEATKTLEANNFDKYEVEIEDNHIRLIGTKNITDRKEGIGGSLKYYRTDFIGENNVLNATDKDKVELAHQAGELLSLAENTLYKIDEDDYWQLYESSERFTAVYFREELDEFEAFVRMVEKLEWPVTVYVFSWGDDEFADEFEHIEGVKVKTIPLPILEIYKTIYNLG